MEKQAIFEYQNFSDFFRDLAQSRGKRGGMKVELSETIGTHPAYLSRVLAGQAQLSPEQVERLAAYLQLKGDEKRYLIFLLHEERAGTQGLKSFYREERLRLQNLRLNI